VSDGEAWRIELDSGWITGDALYRVDAWTSDSRPIDLDGVIAADPKQLTVARAAKAAAEHVRLFMRPRDWVGDDDAELAAGLAVRLLDGEDWERPHFDSCWPEHVFYTVIVVDQIGGSVDGMHLLEDRQSVPIDHLAVLAPLMRQDRNAFHLVQTWAQRIGYPGCWDDWQPRSDSELAEQFGQFTERERTMFVAQYERVIRNDGWQFAKARDLFFDSWGRVLSRLDGPMDLRSRLGIYGSGVS
jgi:hypothetical protein